jgi:hypothetical protein
VIATSFAISPDARGFRVKLAVPFRVCGLTRVRLAPLVVPDACMHVCFLFFCAQRLVRAGELLRDVPFRGGWMEELRSVREGVYPTPTCC